MRYEIMQPPARLINHPWRNLNDIVDEPLDDFMRGEVKGMNKDRKKYVQFWTEEHQ